MNRAAVCVAALLAVAAGVSGQTQQKKEGGNVNSAPLYGFTMKTIDGTDKPLSEYRGKVFMIVNVASFCGYTPQYKDLEALFEKYGDKGFAIAAFPANNFGAQEPGTNEEIREFCTTKYSVNFDLFEKISVKGADQHPLYVYLTKESPFKDEIGWNFTKFLVDKNGTVVARYASKVSPISAEVTAKIEDLLR
jgi:glutathione peroxidase